VVLTSYVEKLVGEHFKKLGLFWFDVVQWIQTLAAKSEQLNKDKAVEKPEHVLWQALRDLEKKLDNQHSLLDGKLATICKTTESVKRSVNALGHQVRRSRENYNAAKRDLNRSLQQAETKIRRLTEQITNKELELGKLKRHHARTLTSYLS